ncbi:MAG: hypothetical protein ACE148_12935 [Vicinamibacterales bacterium]
MTRELERRVEEQRRRVMVRSWEYRQRHHARGAWFRLRRALADASAAFEIPPEEAGRLIAEGYRIEPAGEAFEPRKLILVVPADRMASVSGARPVPLRLGADLLQTRHLALVPF